MRHCISMNISNMCWCWIVKKNNKYEFSWYTIWRKR